MDSLQTVLYRRLDEAPDGRALAWYDPSGAYTWLPYHEVYARASRHALRLSDHGLQPGDVCIIGLPSEEIASTLVMATLLLGAVPLLVAPPVLLGAHSMLLQVLERTVRKTRARLVILPAPMEAAADGLPKRRSARYLFGERDIASDGAGTALPRVAPADTDVAAMQLTSGTTGMPRVCVWPHRNILAGLQGMSAAMRLTPEDSCFNWTPLYHDMGLVNNFLLCLVHRVPLVMASPFEFVKQPALWLRGLSATGATITWSPNFGFALAAQRVKDEELAGVRLDHVRAFWNAAERIHLDTMREFYRRFAAAGVRYAALKTNLGCAENVGGATFSDPDGTFPVEFVDRELLQTRRLARPSPGRDGEAEVVAVVGVGRPYPGMRIHILSRRGTRLPDGYVGEIALDTPSRMAGYLRDTAATRRALSHGLLRTGDLGYLRGGELFWVGRVRERITVRGKKLDPSDFEPVLLRVPGLRAGSFAVFGIDDPHRGTQRVVILAEVREPLLRPRAEILSDITREVFVQLGVNVDDVLLVRPGTLTKTSSGKRRHRYFRKLYEEGGGEAIALDTVGSTGSEG